MEADDPKPKTRHLLSVIDESIYKRGVRPVLLLGRYLQQRPDVTAIGPGVQKTVIQKEDESHGLHGSEYGES